MVPSWLLVLIKWNLICFTCMYTFKSTRHVPKWKEMISELLGENIFCMLPTKCKKAQPINIKMLPPQICRWVFNSNCYGIGRVWLTTSESYRHTLFVSPTQNKITVHFLKTRYAHSYNNKWMYYENLQYLFNVKLTILNIYTLSNFNKGSHVSNMIMV